MKRKSQRPLDAESAARGSLQHQLDHKVRRTRLVIFFERLWPALWLPAGIAGVFLLISLFGLWRYLGFELHRGALWGFAAALVLSLIPIVRIPWPGREEALRRLESAAGLPHRPASSYHDRLAGEAPSSGTRRIWAAHRERMMLLFSRLRAGWPHPRVDRWDPLALRALLILLLAVAFAANREDAGERIRAAFVLKPGSAATFARLDAWITPPVYTGRPPVMIADGARQTIDDERRQTDFVAPAHSELTVRVNDADAARYALRIVPGSPSASEGQGGAGDAGTTGEPEAIAAIIAPGKEHTAEFKQKLTATATVLLLNDGAEAARWSVEVIPDLPPEIALTEPPSEAQRGSVRLKYGVSDDYGVLSAQALIERADGPEDADEERPADVKRLGEAPVIPLTLPRANTKQGDGQTYRDLTAHFWAGLSVKVTLEARDQAGQTGRSEPHEFVLPERIFQKPLAKALIEQRKRLVDRPDLRERVARALDALTIAPELFSPDAGVYLGIRGAYWRLRNNSDLAAMESTAGLLWDIAIHIEDGDLSDAERRLRAAQEALMRALEQGASDEELKRLMEELRTALGDFLEGMRQQAMRNPDFDPGAQLSPDKAITPQDLDRMLKQIEELARTGARDAARQMLSQLRDLLENARPGNQANNGQAQEMMQMLDGLSELIAKQQQLLDETYKTQQGQSGEEPQHGQDGEGQQGQGQQGQGQGQNPFPGLRQQQGDIQGQLQELMNRLKGLGAQPPDQLNGAGQAMGGAGEALGKEDAGRATEQQTLALDKLRQGARSMAEQMMRNMGQAGRAGRAHSGNGDRDPLGRPLPTQGLDDGDSVKVPEEADIQRARQILEELRRRLGERQRPPSELDYIERLIERF